MRPLLAATATLLLACGGAPPAEPTPPAAPSYASGAGEVNAIELVLDDWHTSAAHSDEDRYFGHMTEDAIFLGTDATERWDVRAFRVYAHTRFAAGRGWVMKAQRRHVRLAESGDAAWFDEELASEKMGALRGSGVLVHRGATWKIAHYVLSVVVPNDRFPGVKAVLDGPPPAVPPAR